MISMRLCTSKKLNFHKFWNEFAKLRAFRAQVPYVPACRRAYAPCVPTCLRALNYYAPTCPYFLHAYVPSFFTCLYIFLMPTCFHAINYFVPTYAHFSCAYVEISHKIYWGSLLYLVLLFFSGLFDPLFH